MPRLRNINCLAIAIAVVTLGVLAEMPSAAARGGGSTFMNSPGYQRRLQESRGYVTNQSGSILMPPVASAPAVVRKPRLRRRH